MTSFRDGRTKPSASQEFFGKKYIPDLCNFVYGEYGCSYSVYESHRNTWRANIAYSPEIEEELILFTKTFIRTMCETDSKHTNPQFLRAFIRMIADYLSAYTMRSRQNATRKLAMQALQKTLWDDFGYIQQLLRTQALQRAKRAQHNQRYMSHDHNVAAEYEQMKATQRRLASAHAPRQK